MAKNRLNLSGIIGKYVGAPYNLGNMDCLKLVNSVGRELGADIPNEYGGVTEDNYGEFWVNSPDKAKLTFISYVSSLGDHVDIPYLFPPDLVLFRDGDEELGVGIYVGNGLILSAFVGEEVRLVNRTNYPIEVAIRWVPKHV